MVLCSYLFDDRSDVAQKHRGKSCLLNVLKKVYIQRLKHNHLSKHDVVFEKVMVL